MHHAGLACTARKRTIACDGTEWHGAITHVFAPAAWAFAWSVDF